MGVRGDGAELLRLTDSPGYFSAREFTEFNGEVYFAALTDPGDWQLWHSDGSEAGTAPAADHLFFSNLAQLTNVGGMLYFSAAQSATGQELWRSDGTSLGTYRVQDLNPGSADGIAFLSTSDPRNLTNVNGILFFAGTDGAHGRELWSVVPDGLPPTVESVVLANSLSVHAPVEVATGSGEQLRTVAMAGVDRVTLVFSRDVEVSAADLEVAGHAPLAVSGFAYDASLFAATWSLSEPVVADQITLRLSDQVRSTEGWRLDGDWANPLDLNDPRSSSSSGDGVLGGRFEFRFNVLAGDANRDNVVNTADFDIWAANFDHGQGAADKVFTDGDWNGDGHVTGADFTLWADHNQVAFYNWGAGSPDSLPDMLALRAFAKPDDIQPLALDVKLAQRLTTIRDQVLTHESTEPRVDVELTSYRGHSAAQAREDGAGATQDAIVKVDVRERVDARM